MSTTATKERQLKCADLGIQCNFVSEGKSNDEVLLKMMKHAKVMHKEMIKEKISSMNEKELAKWMKDQIHDKK